MPPWQNVTQAATYLQFVDTSCTFTGSASNHCDCVTSKTISGVALCTPSSQNHSVLSAATGMWFWPGRPMLRECLDTAYNVGNKSWQSVAYSVGNKCWQSLCCSSVQRILVHWSALAMWVNSHGTAWETSVPAPACKGAHIRKQESYPQGTLFQRRQCPTRSGTTAL